MEFKQTQASTLETLLNTGASTASGKYILFLPILLRYVVGMRRVGKFFPSPHSSFSISSTKKVEVSIDFPNVMAAFAAHPTVAVVGAQVIDANNGLILNAGIDFAFSTNDDVTPFWKLIGAGTFLLSLL